MLVLEDERPLQGQGTRAPRPASATARSAAHEPRQGPLSAGRLHQAATRSTTTPRSRRCCCRTCAGRALTLKRYPNGVEGQAFFEKRAPSHRPDWVADGQAVPAGQRDDRVRARRRRRDARLARATSRRSSCTRRWRSRADARPADRGRLRPRPRPAGDDRRVLPRRAAAARDVRRPRPALLRQDLRLQGPAALRAAEQPRRDVRRDQAVRARPSPSCSRARSRSWPSRRMAKARRAGKVLIDWAQNDRAQDDRRRLLAARARAADGLDAGRLGRGRGVRRVGRPRAAALHGGAGAGSAWPSTATSSRPVLSVSQRLPGA